MANVIKEIFWIIGCLVFALILFAMIFTATGQQFLWKAIEPAMSNHWSECTMDNGVERSLVYEEMFNR